MSYPPVVPIPGDDDADPMVDIPDVLAGDVDDDRPLDPDLADEHQHSASADEQAAAEGTLDVEDLP
ncbi:hypothetical protein [Microbacterium sp. CFBP9034]|uniref:hypothetical protein n=1 Tax=Microbacterium sp. CFBP9034 TaxID=3096540 RepID=UPI002A6AAD7C|nr:hypothetical protein [Microbacterium sp. CFBP9034]MDY0908671.1 hypothetical protein [Microbacterium sp. CFBP9034]